MAVDPDVHFNMLRHAMDDVKTSHKTLADSFETHAQKHHDQFERMREERARQLKLREGAARHAAGVSTGGTQ